MNASNRSIYVIHFIRFMSEIYSENNLNKSHRSGEQVKALMGFPNHNATQLSVNGYLHMKVLS